jgi:hypothetical protein
MRCTRLTEYNLDLQAWCAKFLLEIDLKILLRKTGARQNFKIALISLHIDLGLIFRDQSSIIKFRLAPVFVSKKIKMMMILIKILNIPAQGFIQSCLLQTPEAAFP